MSRLQLVIYRSLLRKARLLQKNKISLWIQDAVVDDYKLREALGTGFVLKTDSKLLDERIAARVYPSVIKDIFSSHPSRLIDGDSLRAMIKNAFRQGPPSQLLAGVDVVRALNEQIYLQKISSCCTTNGVRVTVQTYFSYDDSDFDEEEFKYCYRVTIENVGTAKVKILGRHWRFLHPIKGLVSSVRKWGKGIVGHTPELEPGECFSYISSVSVGDYQGSMQGALLVETVETGDNFEAEVANCNYFATTKDGQIHPKVISVTEAIE